MTLNSNQQEFRPVHCSYGSFKKDPAISFHYVGQTDKKPVLCPDCPEQFWTLYTDYYLGGNEEHFNQMNDVMRWIGINREPNEDGVDKRTAEVAKVVEQKLGERIDGSNSQIEFERWEAWAQVIMEKEKKASVP